MVLLSIDIIKWNTGKSIRGVYRQREDGFVIIKSFKIRIAKKFHLIKREE